MASPARGNTQEEIRQESSPGEGSGTKGNEDNITRTLAGPEAAAMNQESPVRAKSPPPAQTSFPLASSNLPNLELLDMAGLRNEYINRLTQHMRLEGEMVKMMLKRHEVNILFLTLTLCECILPYIL